MLNSECMLSIHWGLYDTNKPCPGQHGEETQVVSVSSSVLEKMWQVREYGLAAQLFSYPGVYKYHVSPV